MKFIKNILILIVLTLFISYSSKITVEKFLKQNSIEDKKVDLPKCDTTPVEFRKAFLQLKIEHAMLEHQSLINELQLLRLNISDEHLKNEALEVPKIKYGVIGESMVFLKLIMECSDYDIISIDFSKNNEEISSSLKQDFINNKDRYFFDYVSSGDTFQALNNIFTGENKLNLIGLKYTYDNVKPTYQAKSEDTLNYVLKYSDSLCINRQFSTYYKDYLGRTTLKSSKKAIEKGFVDEFNVQATKALNSCKENKGIDTFENNHKYVNLDKYEKIVSEKGIKIMIKIVQCLPITDYEMAFNQMLGIYFDDFSSLKNPESVLYEYIQKAKSTRVGEEKVFGFLIKHPGYYDTIGLPGFNVGQIYSLLSIDYGNAKLFSDKKFKKSLRRKK